jgi:hypothetical protein
LPPSSKNNAVITIDDLQRIKEQCILGKGLEFEEEMRKKKEMQMKS